MLFEKFKTTDALNNFVYWRLFLLLAEFGSFTKTANVAGCDVSRVSKAVNRLEQSLGVTLLKRTTHNVVLTPAGRRFREQASKMLAEFDGLLRDFETPASTVETDHISIFGSALILEVLFSRWAAQYHEKHPGVRFDLHIDDANVRPETVGYDLTVMFGPAVTKEEKAFVLGELKYSFAASPEYLQKYGTPKHPRELSQHRVIGCSGAMYYSAMLRKDRHWERFHFVPVLTGSSVSVLTELGLSGFGVMAHAYDYFLQEAFDSGKLVRLFPDWELPPIKTSLLVASESLKRPAVQNFIAFVQAEWAKNPSLLSPTPDEDEHCRAGDTPHLVWRE